MEKFDLDEGHWVTVGGRRIFIRDGESLSSAMKKSGKFKSAKKKVDYDKRPQSDVDRENERNNKAVEKIEKGQKDFDPQDFEKWRKEVDPDYEMDDDRARTRYEAYKDTNVRNQSEKSDSSNVKSQQSDIEKASGLKVKKAFETDLYGNGKEDRFEIDDNKWISHTKEAAGKQTDQWSVNELKNGSVESRDFGSYKEMLEHLSNNSKQSENKGSGVQSQKNDIEKASGLKVKKAFESNLYGNGKEDRFELDDGRIVSHTKNAMGKETDQWSVGKFENGSMNEKTFKSYDEMIDHLKGGSDKSNNIEKMVKRGNTYIPIRKGEDEESVIKDYKARNNKENMENIKELQRNEMFNRAGVRTRLGEKGEKDVEEARKRAGKLIEYKPNKDNSVERNVGESDIDSKLKKEAMRTGSGSATLAKFATKNKELINKWADEYNTSEEMRKSIKDKIGNRKSLTTKEYFAFLGSKPSENDIILSGGKRGEDVIVGKDGKLKPIPDNYYDKNNNYIGSKGANAAYKNAFEEYKKKHPNSKLTLNKFIDMSEGK